jgi:hypothetical protein
MNAQGKRQIYPTSPARTSSFCLTLLFGVQNRWIHFLLASFLAVSLALIFALVMIFDRPFQGNMAASDGPYRLIRQQITAR